MSGFKELIQNTFCVLGRQMPKYHCFRVIDAYQRNKGRREEEWFETKKENVLDSVAHLSFHLRVCAYGAAARHG